MVIAVLLTIVLLLAATLRWGTNRAQYYFDRKQLAQDAAQAYVQLSHNAYRHFKELVDIVVLGGDADLEEATLSHQELQKSVKQLRLITDAEIDYVDGQESAEESAELERIAALEQLLAEGGWAFDRILLLQRRGAEESAQAVLGTVLEQTIDKQFKPLIDAAINDELDEVAEAQRQAQQLLADLRLVSMVAAIVAFCLALAMAVWLLRGLSMPLDRLIAGVRQVARGDLTYRIELPGRNEFTYLAKNFNDMTEQLGQQRQHLLAAQAELEDKVDIRTGELQQANEKLQHIDEGRRRFFADISHELRTPLTAIRGEAEVAARGREKTAEEYRDTLARIIELSDQLGRLVEDLLQMARSEFTSMRFDLHPLVLNHLVSDLCEDARVLIQQKQLQLTLNITKHDVNIYGDRVRLRQVLLILIDNACRYSDPGGEITVALQADQGNASLAISDQGMGISDTELEIVFERFYRGEQARNRVASGSGLGLSLAKLIVEAHKGKIDLTSESGQGTCVTITLPAIN